MQNFLDHSDGANRLSVFNFFMAPMQACGLMLSNPKFFFCSLSCALGVMLSFFVYVGGIFILPGILSLVTAMTYAIYKNGAINLSKNLFEANFHYRLKIYCYNTLALLPLGAIIAAGTNLYHSIIDGKLTAPSAVYWMILVVFLCLTFGLVITSAITLAMRKRSRVLASCADAIELLWKNPAGIFALWINWFLELFICYFIIMCAMLVIRLMATSWPVYITSIVSLTITALIFTVFLAHYLITVSLLTIEIFLKYEDEVELEGSNQISKD